VVVVVFIGDDEGAAADENARTCSPTQIQPTRNNNSRLLVVVAGYEYKNRIDDDGRVRL
jgi:hypothetical protein